MGQKVEVSGTVYDLKAGKCLVGGTAYALKKGRTLIGGTGYDVKLAKDTYTVTFTFENQSYDSEYPDGYAELYYGSEKIERGTVFEVRKGSSVTFKSKSGYLYSYIWLSVDGGSMEAVAEDANYGEASYNYVISGNCSIKLVYDVRSRYVWNITNE